MGFFHALMAGSSPIHPGRATLWAFCGGAGNGCLLGGSLFYCPWDVLRLAGVWRETKQRWRGYDKKGFTYKSQYAVVVICSDEEEQEHTYEKLKAEGYRLKVVAV